MDVFDRVTVRERTESSRARPSSGRSSARPATDLFGGVTVMNRGESARSHQLLDACDPLFAYVCALNRAARRGVPLPEARQVRRDVDATFARMAEAADEAGVAEPFARVREPLVFFADHALATGPYPFAEHYPRIAHDGNEYAGDDKFFDLLGAELAADDAGAEERLSIYYACLALGFAGPYAGRPDDFRGLLARVAARTGGAATADENARLTPEAYRHTDRRTLFQPVAEKLGPLAAAAVGLVAVVFVAAGYLYANLTGQIADDLETINAGGAAVVAPASPLVPAAPPSPGAGPATPVLKASAGLE